jgi:sporulation protein YlmC with PRC-barrel domain
MVRNGTNAGPPNFFRLGPIHQGTLRGYHAFPPDKEEERDMEQQQAKNLDTRETHTLIAADKVEGTAVYRSNGDSVGKIERVMIDKRSGKVAYAVLSFGGFLGMGNDHYPLPWSALKYNERLGGYEVNVTEQQLKGAPKYRDGESWDWNDASRGRKVYDYYGTPYDL